MYISEIQKRLMNAIGVCGNHNGVLKLAVENGANPKEITDTYHLALWFEGAPVEAKRGLLALLDGIYEIGLRICDVCGKFMTEGYILGGNMEYACSRECAVTIFCRNLWYGDKAETLPSFRQHAEVQLDGMLEDNPDDYFWTEWYQEL